MNKINDLSAVDLFCGIGGMTHGFLKAGLPVVAGIDSDFSCQYAYETNNEGAKFLNKDITSVTVKDLRKLYPDDGIKVLIGCAPCQPFSTHTQKNKNRKQDTKWGLLYEFGRLVDEVKPDIVSMENVPNLKKYEVFEDFVSTLEQNDYHVDIRLAYGPDYGIPQRRKRLVLLASRFDSIKLMNPIFDESDYPRVEDAISGLERINAGETSNNDRLHRSCGLSEKNLKRIRQSVPGGTWRDWDPELVLECHKKPSGKTYSGVYGRMKWDDVAPTITTQFYTYGTGRFGHPEQDRALSIREGMLLQTFPRDYELIEKGEKISTPQLGRHIGNAVPVKLAEVIGGSILKHLETLNKI